MSEAGGSAIMGGRGWIVAVAAMVSAVLPAMEFIQGYWQKDREMAIAQAKHTHETQRVWIEMAVRQDLPERSKQRVLRFLSKSLDDKAMREWASEELAIVSDRIERAEKERDAAKAEAAQARERAETALVQAREAEAQKTELEEKLREAQASADAEEKARELEKKLAQASANLRDAKQEFATSRAIEQSAVQKATGIESQLSHSARQVLTGLGTGTQPARVFFHIRSEEQQAWAQSLAAMLRASGAVVPHIERLDIGPDRTELRYYRKREQIEVEELVNAARNHGLEITSRYIPGREDDPRIRPRTYELWLAPSS